MIPRELVEGFAIIGAICVAVTSLLFLWFLTFAFRQTLNEWTVRRNRRAHADDLFRREEQLGRVRWKL